MEKRRAGVPKDKSVRRDQNRDQGYDLGVEAAGSGVEDHAELMAPSGVGDELDDAGMPRWDETERAPPQPPFATAGEDLSVPTPGPASQRSLEELRRQARALSIPGRSRMTKMQLANAVHDAMGRG